MTRQVRARLLELLGDATLFTSLAVAGTPWRFRVEDDDDEDAEDPEPIGRSLAADAFDQYLDSAVNTGITIDKMRTYEWLTGAVDFD